MVRETQKFSLHRFAGKLASILILGVSLAAIVSAQSIFPQKLSIEMAVEKALTDNPQTRISDSGIRTAESKIKEAKTGKQPFVQFSQSVIRSNNPVFVFGSLLEQGRFGASNFAVDSLNNPSGLFNFRSVVSVAKPLFDQRQTRSRTRQAEIGKSQMELKGESVRQHLRFDVISTFYSALLKKEMLQVSSAAVRSAEANRKKTRDMVDVGMTTDADFLAAEVELANAEQQKLEAESELTTTKATLNLMLGDDPSLEREFVGDLQEKYFPVGDQDELMRDAFANRPDYLQAELAIKNSIEQKRAIRDQRLPRVDAFGNVGYSSPYIANGSSDYTLGVSLTYTLFDAGRKARIEQVVRGGNHGRARKRKPGESDQA